MTVFGFGWFGRENELLGLKFGLERIERGWVVVTLGILPHSTSLRVRMTVKTYSDENNGEAGRERQVRRGWLRVYHPTLRKVREGWGTRAVVGGEEGKGKSKRQKARAKGKGKGKGEGGLSFFQCFEFVEGAGPI